MPKQETDRAAIDPKLDALIDAFAEPINRALAAGASKAQVADVLMSWAIELATEAHGPRVVAVHFSALALDLARAAIKEPQRTKLN